MEKEEVTASKTSNVSTIFDGSPFSQYQFLVLGLCFLLACLDGFDLTIIGVALPKIADFLHTKPAVIGAAIGIGQFGPVVGALILSTPADRWGRKWMLCASALVFGVFTLMTAFITSVEQLALFRFFAGIGLGGAIPNALTLASEYAPARARTTVVTTMFAGLPAGAVVSGLSAAFLIPRFGWQSLFIAGGCAPLIICLLLALFLPESLEFLVQHGKDEGRIRRIVGHFAPVIAKDEKVRFVSNDKKRAGVPVKHLFMEGRAVTTILLWAILSLSYYLVWILIAWAPTLLRNSGATVQQYSLAYTGLMFGNVVANIFIGRLMDKVNVFRVLQVGYILAAICLVAFGLEAGSSLATMIVLSMICGFFINGCNGGATGLVTNSYPVSIRASGIGWAYGIAKLGAAGAPAVGGLMLGRGWSASRVCTTNALVGVVVTCLLLVLQVWVSRAASVKSASAAPASAPGASA